MFGLSKKQDDDYVDYNYHDQLGAAVNTNTAQQQPYQASPAPMPVAQPISISAPDQEDTTPTQPINDISFSSPYSMHHPLPRTDETQATEIQPQVTSTPEPQIVRPEIETEVATTQEDEPEAITVQTPATEPQITEEPKEENIDLDHVEPDDVDRQLPAGDTEEDKPEAVTTEAPAVPANSSNNDLLDIKREAMEALAPLVEHLDQGPEEKFETAMAIVRETGGNDAIHHAYEAAKNIPDDGARGMALLEVVKEIDKLTNG